MYKHIVLFSDGTGNSSASLFKTNVRRLYEALDLTDPQNPEIPRQFAFYDDGIGTSTFRPLAILGGAIGIGLARNVRDLYAFLCRTYTPGDKIYAFGFSRGAFTIRVLIGLILDQGIVEYDGSEVNLNRNVSAAYRDYRRKYRTLIGTERPLRAIRDWAINLRDQRHPEKAYSKYKNVGWKDLTGTTECDDKGTPKPTANLGKSANIPIEFVGLWDTVDAYGLPVEELTCAFDLFVWPLTMTNYDLNEKVGRACHVLALDDERNTFHPRLWNEEAHRDRSKNHIKDERITQVWFAGVHADVGGGYADDSLAHVSLKWMICEVERYDLRFRKEIRDAFLALEDESGPIHDSRRGLAGYYRYNPRRIEKLRGPVNAQVKPTKVHESVLRRIKVGQDGYAPLVLPPDFAVVTINGDIVAASDYEMNEPATTPGAGDLATETSSAETSPALESGEIRTQVAAGSRCVRYGIEVGEGSEFTRRREHAWNWVWRRRVVYFVTLAMTLFLVIMPLFFPASNDGACTESVFCFASGPIRSLAVVLPSFAETWTNSFASHPGVFLIFAILIAGGIWRGRVLEQNVRDDMRLNWYTFPILRPGTGSAVQGAAVQPPINEKIQHLRTRLWYQRFFMILTQYALPSVFVFGLLYQGVALVSQVTFAVRDSVVGVCASAGTPKLVTDRAEMERPFQTNSLCAPTGLSLEKGAAYRLRITIPADDTWTSNGVPAGPTGIRPEEATIRMTVGVPFRRHLTQPWFKPMARIGETGSDDYPLDPKPPLASNGAVPKTEIASRIDTCSLAEPPVRVASPEAVTFETEMVARTSGELFLYVNDAVLHPGLTRRYYCNNTGSARVAVERLMPSQR